MRQIAETLDLLECADHEAGHYVIGQSVSRSLEYTAITVVSSGRSGGRNYFTTPASLQLDPVQWGKVFLSGAIAQALGRFKRHVDEFPSQTFSADFLLDYLSKEARMAAQDDIEQLEQLVGSGSWAAYLLPTFQAVADKWPEIERVSAALQQHGTIFSEEAEMILENPPEAEELLSMYRKSRRPAPPPKGWSHGPYYEDFGDWHWRAQRAGLL